MVAKSKLIDIDKKGRVLLVRNGKTKQYNLPGGRAWKGEKPRQTLKREVCKQELPQVKLSHVRKWRNPPKFKRKKVTFYFGRAKGRLRAGAEVDRAVRARHWKKMKLSRSTRVVLQILEARGYLKR